MAYELAEVGCMVVSGMTRGIGTQAHNGALTALELKGLAAQLPGKYFTNGLA